MRIVLIVSLLMTSSAAHAHQLGLAAHGCGETGAPDLWSDAEAKKCPVATSYANSILDKLIDRAGLRDAVNKQGGLRVKVECEGYSEINAHQIGKSIVISSAMILRAGSEDEVAFVIAHELGHYLNCDDRVAFRSDKDGRAIEKRADEFGLELISKAGYTPDGAIDGFKRDEMMDVSACWKVPLVEPVVEMAKRFGKPNQDHPYDFARLHDAKSEIHKHKYPRKKRVIGDLAYAQQELRNERDAVQKK